MTLKLLSPSKKYTWNWLSINFNRFTSWMFAEFGVKSFWILNKQKLSILFYFDLFLRSYFAQRSKRLKGYVYNTNNVKCILIFDITSWRWLQFLQKWMSSFYRRRYMMINHDYEDIMANIFLTVIINILLTINSSIIASEPWSRFCRLNREGNKDNSYRYQH